MGRINLTALRIRKRALANLETKRTPIRPNWLDVIGDIPPAQILTRPQPPQHTLTQTRTRTLPNGKTEQYTKVLESRKPKSYKPSRLFSPIQIRYEEDALRKRFFSDHPWELARPRIVLETSGDQYRLADWSRGLIQPGIPLSGESVIQRQLWLLENVPDMEEDHAYDIARKEFYTLRRQEETRRRIAAEEAEAMGAEFGKSALTWGMHVENTQYDNWEKWSRQVVSEMDQRNAAFTGQIASTEDRNQVAESSEVGNSDGRAGRIGGAVANDGKSTIGAAVFAGEAERTKRFNRREGSLA